MNNDTHTLKGRINGKPLFFLKVTIHGFGFDTIGSTSLWLALID